MGRFGALLLAAALVGPVACAGSDVGITTEVKSRLAADEVVDAYEIEVITRNGVVTLSGTVDSQAAKRQALELAREIRGVSQVVDQIRVDPRPRSIAT